MIILVIYLGSSKICVKVTTGTELANHGSLKMVMEDIVIANEQYGSGDVVIDRCFFDLQQIALSNPSASDAWTGHITVTYDGKPTKIDCKGCEGKSYSGSIVVDGDGDGTSQAETHCLHGQTCIITWEKLGIISIINEMMICFRNRIILRPT